VLPGAYEPRTTAWTALHRVALTHLERRSGTTVNDAARVRSTRSGCACWASASRLHSVGSLTPIHGRRL